MPTEDTTPERTVHRFKAQNARGHAGEDRVVAHLEAAGFVVERVTSIREQLEGVDLYATSPKTGERKRLEVKTDYTAARTGNAAVETVSNDATGRLGWVHTTTADFLLYVVVGPDVLYWLTPVSMRANLKRWEREHRHFSAPNVGYCTLGVLVPLAEFEALAVSVVSL